MMKFFKYMFLFFYGLSYSQGLIVNVVDCTLNEKDSLLNVTITIVNEGRTNQLISFTENFCTKDMRKCVQSYGIYNSDTLAYMGLCSTSFWRTNELEIQTADYDNSVQPTGEVLIKKTAKKIKPNKKYTYKLFFCHASNIPRVLKLPLLINNNEEIYYLNVGR